MTKFEVATEEVKLAKSLLDVNVSETIVNYNMALLKAAEAQILDEGGEIFFHIDSFRWNLQQAIINRDSENSMTSAAYNCMEGLQNELFIRSGLGYE